MENMIDRRTDGRTKLSKAGNDEKTYVIREDVWNIANGS